MCFNEIGCLFSLHMFHQNWPLQMLPFFLPLKYFVFWVKNYFRQKIYLRFCCEVPYAVSDVTSFFLFTSYISYKLSASNVAFFCLILPFKYFVFCRKIWFSTKDISSLLLWSTICCLRCCFFFSFITSCVSSKPVAFFHIICFPKKWLLFSRHMFHQNCLLFSRPQQQLSHNESHYTLWLRFQFPSSISISISISVFKVDLNLDLDFSFASASISVSISVFSFDLSFDFSFSGRSQFQLPASTLLEVDFESGFWDLCF